MRYEQIELKMPPALKELIMSQPWCASFNSQGIALPELLTGATYLNTLAEHLSSDERRTLRLIISAFGCEPFTREALDKQAVVRMAGAQVAVGLIGLRRLGVVAAFRKAWGEQLLVLPEDAFAAWQQLLFPAVQLRANSETEPQMELLGPDAELEQADLQAHPRGLSQQLFHFLAACSQQAALPLTNKGTLHKKQLLKLTQHVKLPPDILRSAGLSYAFREIYDDRAALMLELAIQLGCLASDGNHYLFQKDATLSWLQGRYKHQQKRLYLIWRQLMTPAPVWLQHTLALMERAEIKQWCEIDALIQGVRSICTQSAQIKDSSSLREAIFSLWLNPLRLFGFVEIGSDQDDELWFRWLLPPSAEAAREGSGEEVPLNSGATDKVPSMYVQPDFELLLPPDVPLRTEWTIAALAELRTTELVRTYHLTKESVFRAWELGIDGEEIVRILETYAYHEVPAPISVTLRQWADQVGKLYLEEVTLLRCRSSDVADALMRNEKCASFLGQRIGESDFIADAKHLPLLTKCLEQMGFNPKSSRKDASSDVSLSESISDLRTNGLCYSKDVILLYDMDAHIPQQGDVYPDMQGIPASWLQDFGAYHSSTRKDIIRKAIEWKSVIQLRKEGQSRVIIPRHLREERTGWIMEGLEEYQEIALTGEDWEEMKLILPGINDEGVYR
ncbi:helicase-associated domain-containing protein [Paenibacillus marchantiophytorum]|nr:helicase-associated domain-containing protein [Paenibacillus marchantiophytorum]